jgi:hypothetical protein
MLQQRLLVIIKRSIQKIWIFVKNNSIGNKLKKKNGKNQQQKKDKSIEVSYYWPKKMQGVWELKIEIHNTQNL